MCGIAGIHRRTARPVAKAGRLADELLLANENRGRHSTGWLAMLDSGQVQMQKRTVTASLFVPRRGRFSADFRTLLLHNRFATRGAKIEANAHPIISGRCAAVHNGTIVNDGDVFAKLGIERRFTVDSEVIPAAVSAFGWQHAAAAFGILDGGMATAVVTDEAPREVMLARLRSYPLVYFVNRDVVIWASTREAIERAYVRTYGRKPRGRFVDVGDYEIHRINGTIEIEAIEARPVARGSFLGRTVTTTRSKPVSGSTAKRRRKRSRKQTRSNAPVVREPVWEDDVLVDVDQHVRDLMRWANVDRETAEEMIWGA